MRYIEKADEPEDFIEWKAKFKHKHGRKPRYDDLENDKNVKNKLKQSLITEQKNVCGYCCGRVIVDDRSAHIEHIKPRSVSQYEKYELDYTNLLASCTPNPAHDHCGHYKDNNFDEKLFIYPYENTCEDFFAYDELTGEVTAVENNAKANYMIKLLNLNEKRLMAARVNAIWTAEIPTMDKRQLLEYKEKLQVSSDMIYADAQMYVINKLLLER